jgi:predicted DNA binding CopG/RHH family protein
MYPSQAKSRVITVRLPNELIKRIDAHARGLKKQTGLRAVSRTEVVRLLIERGLAAPADKPAE